MDLVEVIYILAGSTMGLMCRLFIRYNFEPKILLNFDNSSIVNILASLFLGILVALNPNNKNLFLFLSVGFLGCFSTFSSFIYQLFIFIQKRKFVSLLKFYVKVLVFSSLFFCLGYFTTLVFKN